MIHLVPSERISVRVVELDIRSLSSENSRMEKNKFHFGFDYTKMTMDEEIGLRRIFANVICTQFEGIPVFSQFQMPRAAYVVSKRGIPFDSDPNFLFQVEDSPLAQGIAGFRIVWMNPTKHNGHEVFPSFLVSLESIEKVEREARPQQMSFWGRIKRL